MSGRIACLKLDDSVGIGVSEITSALGLAPELPLTRLHLLKHRRVKGRSVSKAQ